MKAPNYFIARGTRRNIERSAMTIVLTFCAFGLPASLSAATQYWDPGLTPTANGGTGSGGDGIWTSSDTNWSDGSIDSALVTTNIAGFAGATGTVTLTTAVSTGGMQFDTNNYVIGDGTTTGQISITSQTAAPAGISGAAGTSINVGSIKLGSQGSSTSILLTNTDLVNFNNTTVYLTGSRGNKISNSSGSATTTYTNFAVSDKPTGGTWPNTNTQLDAGNLTITNLAAAASANGTLSTYTSATAVNATFSGIGSGTFTLNGNNTLFNNVGVGGSLSLTFNMANGTLALGHDNALGARNVGNTLTTTSLIMSSGTIAASGGARNIENAVTLSGNASIGGSNALTLSGTFTNSGGNRTLTVNNSAATTLSGPVYLANDDATSRVLTIAGTGNVEISGAITNNASTNTLASALTKSGSGTLTLGGTNTYTGNTTVSAGSLNLASTGSLKFVIQPAAVTNKITGGGSATLNGTFDINVAAAAPSVGNTWTLVETAKTFGASFSVAAPFAETSPGSGLWSFNDGSNNWYFSELSGKLSYGITPELVWDGDSGGAWGTGGNWVGGNAPVSGDTAVFTGSNTTNNNDLSTDTLGAVALEGIIFGPTASSFTLGGNTVNLAGKSVTNYSANAETLAFDIEADNGFTVNTSAGDVSITGSLNTTAGFNKALNKNGTGTLILNGIQNTSWGLNVNAGTMQVFNPNTGGQVTAFTATIAPGATLKAESGDILHYGVDLNNNGTLDVSENGESFGSLLGSGVVTNHGASSAVTCTIFLGSGNSNFSGSIQNGPAGSPTAVNLFDQNTLDVDYYTHTFSGTNTYTGDTTIAHQDASFVLASGGSLTFKLGANGVNNKIAGVDQTAGVGTVTLDGTFNIDLSGAAIADGNSWQIVASELLATTTFDSNFNVAGFDADTPIADQWRKVDGNNTWTFDESTGVLSLSVTGGSSYSTWASANGIPGELASDDYDNDGLSNLMEYALGKNPTTSSNPAGTYGSGMVSFAKGADAFANGDVTWAIEESDDLGISDPWTVVTPTVNNSTTISYTLPTGKSKIFVRLVVGQP